VVSGKKRMTKNQMAKTKEWGEGGVAQRAPRGSTEITNF
jgi:hypothetical protein